MDLIRACDVEQFKKNLGAELKNIRRNERRLSRAEVCERMAQITGNEDFSVQTLGTYEQGTRNFTVARLLEVCAALDVRADKLFASVYERTFPDQVTQNFDLITVNLSLITESEDARLQPLRPWAQEALHHSGRSQLVLDRTGLRAFTHQTGLTQDELLALLRGIDAVTLHKAAA